MLLYIAIPPYKNTTSYKDPFDHDKFWKWCREKVKSNYELYVSEYDAPDDFICIWEKNVYNQIGDSRSNEKLFVHESQYRIDEKNLLGIL